MTKRLAIIGAGLAGSEAALQLARLGLDVTLYDIKPQQRTAAHHNPDCAEIVCSNSLGSQSDTSASGLLKAELALLACQLLALARQVAVPAGQALAVDRDGFARAVTERLEAEPRIHRVCAELSDCPAGADLTLIATGPLTTPALADTLARWTGRAHLAFFDAASPIVATDSINREIAFTQDRYDNERQHTGGTLATPSYLNCPLDRAQYAALRDCLLSAERTELKAFEREAATGKPCYFESCLPIEVLAERGVDTMRYGPLKPVGLEDPRTGKRPYAVVQLRRDNLAGTLYNLVGFQTNLKWGAQQAMIRLIPGLEQAEIVRYGVMHRNTYLHAPDALLPTLQLRARPDVFIAGQLTGTEGYTEAIATGLLAAHNMARLATGQTLLCLPPDTMLGALMAYITRPEAVGGKFQPINSNWGILPPLSAPVRDKRARQQAFRARALASMAACVPGDELTATVRPGLPCESGAG